MTIQFVLALVASVVTSRAPDAKPIAQAIATVIDRDCKGDGALGSCDLDAAALVVTAHEESNFTQAAISHDGRGARCALQVEGHDEHVKTVIGCVRVAYAIMRASAKLCPAHPLASYAGSCNWRRSQRISDRRMLEAMRLLATWDQAPE